MPSTATDHVLHGLPGYIDCNRAVGHRWQILVSDWHATVLSNFLAVFLALAFRNLYNICKRIVRALRNRYDAKARRTEPEHDQPDESHDAESSSPGSDASNHPSDSSHDVETRPAGSRHNSQAVSNSREAELTSSSSSSDANNIVAGSPSSNSGPGNHSTDNGPDAASQAPTSASQHLTVSRPENVVTMLTRSSDEAGDLDMPDQDQRRRRQLQPLEVVEAATDPESLISGSFVELSRGLRDIVPQRHLSDNVPLRRRMRDKDFWDDLLRLAKADSGRLLWSSFIFLGALAFYVMTLVLGILSAYPVVGDSVALSRHPNCGLFVSNATSADERGSPPYASWTKQYNDLARESRQYAKQCYGFGQSAHARRPYDSCSFLYQANIPYTVFDNDVCPFKTTNGTYLCLDGESGAYAMTTGTFEDPFIDSSALGINTPLSIKFHRDITCAPLKDLSYSFRHNGTLTYRYFYGNQTGDFNCTSELPDCSFEVPVYPILDGVYRVRTQTTHRDLQPNWEPIFAVNETLGETATLILISNNGIAYPSESQDPIFQADTQFSSGWYYSTRLKASVLGCMSRTLFCLEYESPLRCYNSTNFGNFAFSDEEHVSVRAMLKLSLAGADLEGQVSYLQGEAFDAQSLLVGRKSSKISNGHWKLEVRQLFETVLARTQLMAKNIARGSSGVDELPGRENLIGPEFEALCTRYKFRSIGWKNISVTPLLVEFFFGLTVYIVGVTRGDKEDEELWVEEPVKQMARSSVCKAFTGWLSRLAGKCWRRG